MPEAVDRTSYPRRPGRDTPMSITGVGAVTGYGWGTKHVWDGFLLGESAVKLTHRPRRVTSTAVRLRRHHHRRGRPP